MQKLKSIAAGLCLGIAAVGIAVGSAHPAHATIMAEDLSEVSGLDTFITRDSVSGLDWLDVNLTTSVSFNGITGGGALANGGALNGTNPLTFFANPFRHATRLEINQLFTNAFIPDIDVGFSDANFAPVNALKTLLGPTGGFVFGIMGTVITPGSVERALLEVCASVGAACTVSADPAGPFFTGRALQAPGTAPTAATTANSFIGHFLVRSSPALAVPEPPAWTLMVCGLIALAWFRHRRACVTESTTGPV